MGDLQDFAYLDYGLRIKRETRRTVSNIHSKECMCNAYYQGIRSQSEKRNAIMLERGRWSVFDGSRSLVVVEGNSSGRTLTVRRVSIEWERC